MKIKNGKTDTFIHPVQTLEGDWMNAPHIFGTDLPDGDYDDSEIGLKISDGEKYPKYPIGCLLVDSKVSPVFPSLDFF